MSTMDTTSVCRAGPVFLLVACLLIAGCSDTTTAQPVPTTSTGPRYTAGDIVRNPASAASTAWLVIGYDATSDTYERALIYQNADGSWGYRSDTRTDKTGRSVMDRVYTEKLANVPPSSVPVGAPTIVTTVKTTETPLPATTVTPTAPRAPVFTGIIPDEGYAGTNVSVRNVAGENFVVGAKVMLSRNASTIPATEVRYISNKSLICTLVIPSDAAAGSWDVTVTNPDGQSDTFTNVFTVRRDTSVTETTSPTFSGSVPVTSLDPPFAASMGRIEFIITGSKFQNGAAVTLQKAGKPDIVADTVIVNSATQIRCFFIIPSGSRGFWDIVITNPDQTYGRWAGGLEIRS